MTQAQEPVIPTKGETPDGQRLLAGVREFIQTVMRQGIFLQRSDVGPLLIPRTGQPAPALSFGSMNRTRLSGDFDILLPRIEPKNIGVPLLFIIIDDTSNVATLTPVGFGLGNRTVPKINDAATQLVSVVGRYVLQNDGQNWYMTEP